MAGAEITTEPDTETDEPDPAPADDRAEVPRRSRTALTVSLVVAVLVAGFVVVLATREPATDRQTTSRLIGQPAPPLAGETMDGGSFDIGDHRGQWVVVNFFAEWCGPCRREHPQLVNFDEVHRTLGDATLVSVVFQNDTDDVREFFEDNGGEWPVVLDPRGEVATAYGVPQVPETYVVNPQGVVVAKLIGGVTQAGLERAIQESS